MNRTLILMRHAKSDWDSQAQSDRERPLNKRGRKDAPRMGRWLGRAQLIPDQIYSSPSLRTRQTVDLLRQEIELKDSNIAWVDGLYHPDMETFLSLVGKAEEGWGTLMLVSHNPGLEELLLHLSDDYPPLSETGKLLPTGAVAVLVSESEHWSVARESYTLEKLVRPRELED